MRTIFWILTGCGVVYLIHRSLETAGDLKSTIDAVNRQVDTLEQAVRDLGSRDHANPDSRPRRADAAN